MNDVMNYGDSNPFKIFDYKNLGSVKISIKENGSVWFCLDDICKILPIGDLSDVIKKFDTNGVDSIEVIDSKGITQELTFIDEINLQENIIKSENPEVKEFRTWIVSDVLSPMIAHGHLSLEKKINNMKLRQNEVEKRQSALIEYGYHTISKFAKYYGVNLLERDKQILEEKVIALCNQKELSTGKEPEGLLMVNSYPYPALVEVFQNFVSSNNN